MNEIYDVIIIGAGPAGLTAGLYCAQGGLKVLVLEKENIGGQILNIEKIENYPGFGDGITGPQLRRAMTVQAKNYGVEIKIAEAQGLEITSENKRVRTTAGDYFSKVVIIAGGGHPMRLGVPGEEKFINKGVAYCAMCDRSQFEDKIGVVAGGGDAGVTGALYLSKIAKKIVIIEVMPQLSAKYFLQERARKDQKIEIICNRKIKAILGDTQVRTIDLLNTETKGLSTLSVDGVLVHVGWEAASGYLKGVIPLNSQGEILVNERMETEFPGVFAAGDIRHGSPRQIATAVGDGATAAISALKYVQEVIDA